MSKPKKQLSEETLLLAYRLQEARAKKYKTIKEAAETLPVQRTLWSHWENAFVRPQDATLRKLSAMLDVPPSFFRRKPENWDTERNKFLAELITRTRTRRAYYNSFRLAANNAGADDAETPQEEVKTAMVKPTRRMKPAKGRLARVKPERVKLERVKPERAERAPKNTTTLDVFFQITGLIADAQNKVATGEISRETYHTHMRMIADMVKISLFAAP